MSLDRGSAMRDLAFGALTCGFLLATALPTRATDPPYETTAGHILFESYELLEPPFTRAGVLWLNSSTYGLVSLPELGFVWELEAVVRPGNPAYSVEGPWQIRLHTPPSFAPLDAETVEESPLIADFELFAPAASAGGPESVALGEAHRVLFPREAEDLAGRGGFCREQPQFHYRETDELPTPTLLAAGTDACAWLNEEPGVFNMNIDMPQAWAISTGSADVVVAVVDLGVDWLHPDLFGGSAPSGMSYDELMLSSYAPNIFRNEAEALGDANEDGASGEEGVDEDFDGWFDEDHTGLFPNNVKEGDVRRGTWSSVGVDLLVANHGPSEAWEPGELVGLELVGKAATPVSRLSSTILWNDAHSVRVELSGFLGSLMQNFPAFVTGWNTFADPGDPFLISDLRDTDHDLVIDDWWDYDPSDDDENGLPDDIRGWSFTADFGAAEAVLGNRDARPSNYHGTAVAGIIGAQFSGDGSGLAGIAPNVRILPVRFGYSQETSTLFGTEPAVNLAIARAIEHVLQMRDANGDPVVDIISLATGLTDDDHATVLDAWNCSKFLDQNAQGRYVDPLANAIQRAIADGVLIINGAGNTDEIKAESYFTSCFPQVLTVGGVRVNGRPWWHTELDGGMTAGPWVDVLAPASNITLLGRSDTGGVHCTGGLGLDGNPYTFRCQDDGTSLAAPHVTGVAALLLSTYPNLTAEQVRAKLLTSVDPNDYDRAGDEALIGNAGSGQLNAFKALTWYGDITQFDIPLVWADDVWVSGDIYLPSGSALTIEPGTVIHVAQDDIQNWGMDPEHPERAGGIDPEMLEFIVDGTIVGSAPQKLDRIDPRLL